MTPRLPVRWVTGSWTIRILAAVFSVALAGCSASLPEEDRIVRDVLHTDYPAWRLVTARDLSADQQRQWTAEHQERQPGLTSGDYFGDKSKCYAALLVQPAKEGRRVSLVVLKPTRDGGRFEAIRVFVESPVDTMPQIFTSKAGEYQVFLEGRSMPVPTEGIVYLHGGGRQKLFFWNVEKFQDIELTP